MGMPPEHGLGGAEAVLMLFVGDADQLPSVEPGKFLGDILFILDTGGLLSCSGSAYRVAS